MRFQSMVVRFTVMLSVMAMASMVQPGIAATPCPCDIYKAGGNPCVAAHSTVRALYATYNGPLYQVMRIKDSATLDIGVLTPGGLANTAKADSFCAGTRGYLNAIYDQSGKGNDLWVQGSAKVAASTSSKPVRLDTQSVTVAGLKVYPVYINPSNCFWHDASASGIALGSQPEGMYMVTSGTHFNGGCCFDYGNSETDRKADGSGTMDALNFSSNTQWGTGAGSGPWVMADLEYGMFAQNGTTKNQNDPTQTGKFVTAMLKNNGTTEFALRGANAQSGALTTYWKGALPSGWNPMKKQGAIILGCGGDCCKPGGGANNSDGTLYEGAIVLGYPADSTENAVQANVVAAGYGATSAIQHSDGDLAPASPAKVGYSQSKTGAVIGFALQRAQSVSVNIYDPRGRRIAAIADGVFSVGWHEAVWNAGRTPAGVYLCRVAIGGAEGWAGKIVIGK